MKNYINRLIEIKVMREISNKKMHQLLHDAPESDYTKKVLTAKMLHLKPTRNPLVLLYRMLRDRKK